jgi:hypothetical protein
LAASTHGQLNRPLIVFDTFEGFPNGQTDLLRAFLSGILSCFLDSRRVIAAITRETMKYASLQEFNANKLLLFP